MRGVPAMRGVLTTLAVLAVTVACDRQPPSPTPRAKAVPPSTVATVAPRKSAAELVRYYLYSRDASERRRTLYVLQDMPGNEALPAVERLLQAEREPELRVELLESLDVWDGNADVKVRVLERELLDDPRPGAVYDAALDALMNLRDPAALPLWWQLLDDPRDQVRAVARDAIARLEDSKSDAP